MAMKHRILVTGREGQVVSALRQRAEGFGDIEIVTLGRPTFDMASETLALDAIADAKPDLIVSAAAYTAVDQAESDEETALRVNGKTPGEIAKFAARLDIPLFHLSTDYVFDGLASRPYRENDPVAPQSAYGRSKLAGEQAIMEAGGNFVILRTAWVYSPFGRNFLKTMLTLAESRDELRVVADQIGNPTSALDIADGILTLAHKKLAPDAPHAQEILHMTGSGEASWADFAQAILAESHALGGPWARVEKIPSSSYPTPAKRPANSRLDCTKLATQYGITLPAWQASCADAVGRLLAGRTA